MALRCCAVPQTRLDSARIRAARRVIDPVFPEDRDRFAGRPVVTIACGSNVDIDAYHRWVGAAPIH